MGIFEKIEMESVEEPQEARRSARQWSGEELVVESPLSKRLSCLLVALCILPFFGIFLDEDLFFFKIVIIASAVGVIWYLGRCFLTYKFTFTPTNIIRHSHLGQTVLPVRSLIMHVTDQQICFYHGSSSNFREAIKIYGAYISEQDTENIIGYAQDIYHPKTPDQEKRGKVGLAMIEFQKAADSYKMLAIVFGIVATVGVFAVGLLDNFYGLAPEIPAFPARLLCMALAAAGFVYLKKVVMKPVDHSGTMLLQSRLAREGDLAFRCGVVACTMAAGGFILFLLAGNMLDFFMFLLIAVLCLVDFYPQYSRWEQVAAGPGADPVKVEPAILPQRRSFQVSLVLMGTLAVASYGQSYHYIYKNRQDCLDDWGGDEASCSQTTSTGQYRGPRYGSRIGTSYGRPGRAIGVSSVSRGGFGRLGSFHSSFGG